MSSRLRVASSAVAVAGLVLCFVTKPVHVDDTNFLRLAEGVARDPWRPHDIAINWLGTTQRSFDVLANPPGIAYWLAPVRSAPEWLMHLWMLPWLGLALFGIARAARAFAVPADRAILLLGTSPVFVLSAQSLTPDLALLGCALTGVAGFATAQRRAWAWALLAGCAALFRYSGLCMVPLLLLLGLQRRRLLASLAVAIAPALLFLHDLHAYGQVHVLAMAGFESQSLAPMRVFNKLVAALAMLGGACLLPVLPWRPGALPLAAAGAALGLAAGLAAGHTAPQLAATVSFSAAGGLALGSFALREPDDRFLAAWFFGGYAFLLALLFMATRYWLPFAPALLLAALRRSPSTGRFAAAVGLSAALSFALARDDDGFARAYRDAAREIAQRAPAGLFAGHWGWQYYMEQAGWRAIEAGQPVPERLAVAFAPWPQQVAGGECLRRESGRVLPGSWPIRVYASEGAANFHSFDIAGPPYVSSFAPWTISREPWDEVVVVVRCEQGASGPGGTSAQPPGVP